jgi:hypothetical protein
MASTDFHDPHPGRERRLRPARGPRPDTLGLAFFLFHLAVCLYILSGWAVSSAPALMFYLVFLPVVAMQWMVNHSSCVINNLETFMRTGHWRDASNPEEGRFVSMILSWLFVAGPSRAQLDFLCYGTLFVLWLLAFAHLSILGETALLSLFP